MTRPVDPATAMSHPLTYVRSVHGWSLRDLADLVGTRNTQTVWRWERWNVTPDETTQRRLAAQLGVPRHRLRTAPWPAWLPVGEGIDLEVDWTPSSCHRLLDAVVGDAVLDRRGFMTLAPGSAEVLADRWQSTAQTAVNETGDAGPNLIDSLRQRLPLLRGLEDSLGGGRSVRILVDAELRTIAELLNTSAYNEPQGKALFQLAAELCRIAGWASLDAGCQSAAERYFTTGLRAAHAAGDREAGANLLKCMSLQLVDNDRPREALQLARAAREGTAASPARVRAMLTVRQARMHAVLGERAECEQLLIDAERLMGRADAEPAPGWSTYFDCAEYYSQVAICHFYLGRYQAAGGWFEKGLELQPATRERDGITYLVWRAEAAAQAGEPDRACAHLTQAVSAITRATSQRNRMRLASAWRLLAPHRSLSDVKELAERMGPLVAACA